MRGGAGQRPRHEDNRYTPVPESPEQIAARRQSQGRGGGALRKVFLNERVYKTGLAVLGLAALGGIAAFTEIGIAPLLAGVFGLLTLLFNRGNSEEEQGESESPDSYEREDYRTLYDSDEDSGTAPEQDSEQDFEQDFEQEGDHWGRS